MPLQRKARLSLNRICLAAEGQAQPEERKTTIKPMLLLPWKKGRLQSDMISSSFVLLLFSLSHREATINVLIIFLDYMPVVPHKSHTPPSARLFVRPRAEQMRRGICHLARARGKSTPLSGLVCTTSINYDWTIPARKALPLASALDFKVGDQKRRTRVMPLRPCSRNAISSLLPL